MGEWGLHLLLGGKSDVDGKRTLCRRSDVDGRRTLCRPPQAPFPKITLSQNKLSPIIIQGKPGQVLRMIPPTALVISIQLGKPNPTLPPQKKEKKEKVKPWIARNLVCECFEMCE